MDIRGKQQNLYMDTPSQKLSVSRYIVQNNSFKDVSDCGTVVSDLQTLEENYFAVPNDDLETSFRTDTPLSKHKQEKFNPCMKKSKIGTSINFNPKAEINGQKSNILQNNLMELEAIERRTENLVNKQKQQRKQLKKIKKMYQDKVQELTKTQQQNNYDAQCRNSQIQDLISLKNNLYSQKQKLKISIGMLQADLRAIKQQLNENEAQKEQLSRKIQLLQVNFNPIEMQKHTGLQQVESQDRIQQIIEGNTFTIDNQLQTLDGLIALSIKTPESLAKYKQLYRLNQLKVKYLQQRERLNLRVDGIKYEKVISKLNSLVLSRDNLIKIQKRTINQLTKNNTISFQRQEIQEKDCGQTQETFLSSTFRSQSGENGLINCKLEQQNRQNVEQKSQQPQKDNLDQWQNFKQKAINLINCKRIEGNEQAYDALERITISLLNIFQNQNSSVDDALSAVELILNNLNEKIVLKAHSNIKKIQNMLTFMKHSDTLVKKKIQSNTQSEYKSSILTEILRK